MEQFGHKSVNISLDVCTFAKKMCTPGSPHQTAHMHGLPCRQAMPSIAWPGFHWPCLAGLVLSSLTWPGVALMRGLKPSQVRHEAWTWAIMGLYLAWWALGRRPCIAAFHVLLDMGIRCVRCIRCMRCIRCIQQMRPIHRG